MDNSLLRYGRCGAWARIARLEERLNRPMPRCPVCGKQLPQNEDGSLAAHERKLGAGLGTFRSERCPGSDRKD